MEAIEDGLDETSLEQRLKNPPPPVQAPKKEDRTDAVAKEVAAQGDQTLIDWFKTFSGSSLKISLHRTAPEVWEGRQVAGHLTSFDELIDEDQIAERYGGGKYQIKAQKQLPNGRWNFAGAKTIKIAGDPKITAEHFKDKDKEKDVVIPLPVANPDADVTKAALGSMERFAVASMERAERIEKSANEKTGLDPVLLGMLTKPLESQIATLNAQLLQKDQLLIEKDRIIKDLTERRPDTTLQDRLLDKMYDGESAKLNNLRAQFDSERRQLIDNHQEALKRAEHRSDNERSNLMEAHKRELRSLEQNYEHSIKAAETSFKGLLDAKDNRIKDLERTISRQDVEIAELRAKKEKTIIETMQEFATVRETMEAIGIGGKESSGEESTAERIIGMVAENPIVQGIGQRIASGDPAPQPRAAPPRALAPQRPRPPAQTRPAQRPQQRQTQAPPAPAAPLPAGVTPEAVQTAVGMMEAAVANGTEPDVFAQSIRNMVPGAVVNYIQVHGIDSLLEGVAQLNEASPLSTQVGRNFARRVAKALTAQAA